MSHAAAPSLLTPAAREVILALADDELCVGQQTSTWIGMGPFLEEDLAFISIAQDELSHARALYQLVASGGVNSTQEGDPAIERQVDWLALGRPPEDYRSCWLAEDRCWQWSDALVRHVLYDEAETLRWQALCGSSVEALASLAERVLVEEVFHRRHGSALLLRLLAGTEESRQRVHASLTRLVPLAASLFEPTDGHDEAVAQGVMTIGMAELRDRWVRAVAELLARGGVELAALQGPDFSGLGAQGGGRRGRRSAGFAELYAEMGLVYHLDPSATW